MERFWSKAVKRRGSSCWWWTGGKNKSGYGVFKMDGRSLNAHRVAYMIHHGEPVPEGQHVLHHCDNPSCVNPEHLFLGTNLENHQDKARKGRAGRTGPRNPVRGESNHKAKFTVQQVATIRASAVTQAVLAAQHGVTQSTISKIRRGAIWGGP